MLDDLVRYSNDPVAFRDRVPGVLALLAVVTSTIASESSGHRTAEFGTWWASVDRSAQESIQEMRTAELKEQQSFTAVHVHTRTAVRPVDYPDPRVNDGDSVATIKWAFEGGAFHGQLVILTLRDYLRQVTELVEEAERKLAS